MTDDRLQEYLTLLRELLAARFNMSELRTLCFDLGVDYDSLPGEGKADKARELVSFCDRHDKLAKLIEAGKRLRPEIPWQPAPESKAAPTSPPVNIAGDGNVVGNNNVVQIIKAEGGSTITGVTQVANQRRKKRSE